MIEAGGTDVAVEAAMAKVQNTQIVKRINQSINEIFNLKPLTNYKAYLFNEHSELKSKLIQDKKKI